MDTTTLLDKLVSTAQKEGITNDASLARKLGLTQTAITHMRVGRRKAGAGILCHITRAFPELDADVLAYLRGYEGDK